MAEEGLEQNQGNQEAVATAPATAGEAPSEALTKEAVLSMIQQARTEAEERALRQAQSLVDKATARTDQKWARKFDGFVAPYEQALKEMDADPEQLKAMRAHSERDWELEEAKGKLREFEELEKQRQVEAERETYIRYQLDKYNIPRNHPKLDMTSADTFLDSVYTIRLERETERLKTTNTDVKRQDLERLQQAGALDVTGGGAAMAQAAWSTSKLVLGSDESIISGHLMHYYGSLKPEELGQKIAKVMQLIKQEPTLQGKLKEAARRVHDSEQAR